MEFLVFIFSSFDFFSPFVSFVLLSLYLFLVVSCLSLLSLLVLWNWGPPTPLYTIWEPLELYWKTLPCSLLGVEDGYHIIVYPLVIIIQPLSSYILILYLVGRCLRPFFTTLELWFSSSPLFLEGTLSLVQSFRPDVECKCYWVDPLVSKFVDPQTIRPFDFVTEITSVLRC